MTHQYSKSQLDTRPTVLAWKLNANYVLSFLYFFVIVFILSYYLFVERQFGWGYSEFLINYSAGFTRRGLPGSILIFLYDLLGIEPYVILSTLISFLVVLVAIYLHWIVTEQSASLISRSLFLFNPALMLFLLSQDTFLRKDWLIIFALFFNLFIHSNRINLSRMLYWCLVISLILFLAAITLAHEVNILFIPIHIYILFQKSKAATLIQTWKSIILLAISQLVIAILLIANLNLGVPERAQIIFENIPASFEPSEETILSNSWSFGQNFALVLEMFNFPTIFVYLIFLIVGPMFITWFFFQQKLRESSLLLSYVYFMFAILLTIGWDWGRWISLISFTLIGISTIAAKKFDVKGKYSEGSYATKVVLSTLIICFSLVFSFPSNGTRDNIYLSKTFVYELINFRDS
jgi:hypothetical protein